MGNRIEVKVPDIGDASDVEVIEILVAVGDVIAQEQSLITVESDKASMEIPAPAAGTVVALQVQLGDKVSEGAPILVLEVAQEGVPVTEAAVSVSVPETVVEPPSVPDVSPAPAVASSVTTAPALASTPVERDSPTAAYAAAEVPHRNLPHASPSVRKFARELGVDLTVVSGSGVKNRITHDDVRQFVKRSLAGTGASSAVAVNTEGFSVLPWPRVDFGKYGAVVAQPLSRIKKISGANLHRNWVMIPHVTNHEVADITELEALRKTLNREQTDVKVTMLAFLLKAVVAALKAFPEFNASLDGDNLILKQYYHIGFAADTPNGLVVPVLRDVDQQGVLALAAQTAALAKLARDGKLAPTQMQGGCFSISSLGGIGGTHFTPIINAPEVAILGVGRAVMAPVWDGQAFTPRLQLPLSLSYDHRVIDGAAAARFNAYLAALLADFRRIAL